MSYKIRTRLFFLLLFLFPLTALGQLPPPPYRIGGTLTVNENPITSDNHDGYLVRVVQSDGTPMVPAAVDDNGIDPNSGWYLIDVPIFDAAEQPGGARPETTAVIEVFFNGTKLTVTDPPEGEFTVGNSGQTRRIDVEALQQTSNRPPVAEAGPDQNVTEGASVTLDGRGSSDPDAGDTLSFFWEQIDGGTPVILSDPTLPQPTFTAPAGVDTEAVLTFRLTVSDSADQTATDTVSVRVRAREEQAPEADAGPDQMVTEGDSVTLDGSNSSNPDSGEALTFEWEQISGTPVALSDPFDPRPSFIAPNVGSGGEILLVFQLTVENNASRTDSDTVMITVRPVGNQSPTADAGPNQRVIEGDEVTLYGAASFDPDPGDSLAYAWEQIDGPAVNLSDDTDPLPRFTAPSAGGAGAAILEFRLTVRDTFNATDSDTVTITVTATPSTPNRPPVADAGPDRTAEAGETVLLDGTGSRDTDGRIIAFQWVQVDGETSVSLAGASEPEARFTAPNVRTTHILRFELRVIDNLGDDATDQVSVTLVGDGRMPVADAGPDRTVREGDMAVLDGSGSNAPEGEIVSYRWMQVAGIDVGISDPNRSRTTFSAPPVEDDTLLTFQLEVTDDAGITNVDTVGITILDSGPGPGDDDSTCFVSALRDGL